MTVSEDFYGVTLHCEFVDGVIVSVTCEEDLLPLLERWTAKYDHDLLEDTIALEARNQ